MTEDTTGVAISCLKIDYCRHSTGVVHLFGKEKAAGSNPADGSECKCGSSSVVELLPSKQNVASSNLVFRSMTG